MGWFCQARQNHKNIGHFFQRIHPSHLISTSCNRGTHRPKTTHKKPLSTTISIGSSPSKYTYNLNHSNEFFATKVVSKLPSSPNSLISDRRTSSRQKPPTQSSLVAAEKLGLSSLAADGQEFSDRSCQSFEITTSSTRKPNRLSFDWWETIVNTSFTARRIMVCCRCCCVWRLPTQNSGFG